SRARLRSSAGLMGLARAGGLLDWTAARRGGRCGAVAVSAAAAGGNRLEVTGAANPGGVAPGSAQLVSQRRREVGQYDIRSRPANRRYRLPHRLRLIEHAALGGCLDHRVLAAHLIGTERGAEP